METDGALDKRCRALENEFFYRVDKELGERLRARMAAEADKLALIRACSVLDEPLIETLVAAGITAESLVAITFVPLVWVAWVDGKVQQPERDAILKAAAEGRCLQGSVGRALLESWLNTMPDDSLYDAWQSYTRTLCESLPDDARQRLRDQIVGNVRTISAAAGGILGIKKTSAKEKAMLEKIERVFQTT